MKIISKFKDYYDYKVSEYGVDELLVYDRRKSHPLSPSLKFPKEFAGENIVVLAELYIGNQLVFLFVAENKVYTHFDIIFPDDKGKINGVFQDMEDITFSDGKTYQCISFLERTTDRNKKRHFAQMMTWGYFMDKSNLKFSRNSEDFQEKFDLKGYYSMFPDGLTEEPILAYYVFRDEDKCMSDRIFANPCLNDLKIYIDPDFVWQNIVQFLSDLKSQAEKSPEVSNDQKIENKGFDKKTSFRPRMK